MVKLNGQGSMRQAQVGQSGNPVIRSIIPQIKDLMEFISIFFIAFACLFTGYRVH